MLDEVVDFSRAAFPSSVETGRSRVPIGLLLLLGATITNAANAQQVPTVGGVEVRAFHHVIAVGETQQILGVAAGSDSVLWIVAPSNEDARRMRIADTEQNPVTMTVLANAVRFDAAQPQVSQVWKHTGRVVRWETPVPIESGFQLALGDHAKVGNGYKVSLVSTPQNWTSRRWTEEEAMPKTVQATKPARKPGSAIKELITLDNKQLAVEHSYRILKENTGLVAEVRLAAEGFGSDVFELPFAVEHEVQQSLAKGANVEHTWKLIDVSSPALDCLAIDDRTVLVVSRDMLLRSALATAFHTMQTQMVTAATDARPPYDVFVAFEKAYRAAALLAALLAERVLSSEEQKAVRLSLANATLYFRNLHLWASTVQVQMLGGTTRELPIFFSKRATEHRCAPTHALIHERQVDGRGYLGLVRLNERADVLLLDLDAELVIDPFVLARANEVLGKSGHRIGNLYSDWTLAAVRPTTDGLLSVRIKDQNQARLALTFELDTTKAGLVLWRLATAAGLPVRFKWEAGGQSGEVEIPFSLGRRFQPSVVLERGQLINNSAAVASVEYLRVDDRFLRPNGSDAGLLLANHSTSIVQHFGVVEKDLPRANLPATAVVSEVYNPLDEFIQEEGLTEQIRVRNLLPARDDEADRTLRFVEVTVSRVLTDGTEGKNDVVTARAGPFRLAPKEADGSERSMSFLKFGGKPGEKVQYRITGRAEFTDGSADFQETLFETRELNLDKSMLK